MFDNELAMRLRRKADHWSDPERWSDEEVRLARIGIDEVAEDARQLLNFSQTSHLIPSSKPEANSENDEYDVFISHASEDKEKVAAPLAFELAKQGYKVWYDRFQLRLGDVLRQEIDKGLSSCRYGVVILSPSFFSKKWTLRELDSFMALEDSDGRKRILPVLHNINHNELGPKYSATMATRISASTKPGISSVVNEIVQVLRT